MTKLPIQVVLLVVFSISFSASAQLTGNLTGERFLGKSSSAVFRYGQADVKGSPYLVNELVPGEVVGKEGKFTGLPMRYNMLDDNVEFQQKGTLYFLSPDPRIGKIVIGTQQFVVEKFEFKGKEIQGFVEQLDSGKISLYSKKVVVFKEKDEVKPMEYNPKPARFERMPDVHYYRVGKGPLVKVSNMKKLIDSLPDKKSEMKSFAQSQGITDDRDGLIRFFKHYNSL